MTCFVKTVTCLSGPISSRSNAKVRAARRLINSRRARERESLLFIEGNRLVLDAVSAGCELESLFYCDEALDRGEFGGSLRKLTAKLPANQLIRTTSDVMDFLTDTVNGQGVAAILKKLEVSLPSQPTLVVAMDGVADPGNVGTLVRASAGAGADAVILAKGSADAYGLKALRAGMGAQFRLPVCDNLSWERIAAYAREHAMMLVVADASAEHAHFEFDWRQPAILVVGSEAEGPSEEALALADKTVRIPLREDSAESLNAAVAGAVILFEAQRQRMVHETDSGGG